MILLPIWGMTVKVLDYLLRELVEENIQDFLSLFLCQTELLLPVGSCNSAGVNKYGLSELTIVVCTWKARRGRRTSAR